MIRIAFAAIAALFVCACFDTPKPTCSFRCGDDGECPADYRCDNDGWCKLENAPATTTCAPPMPDAAPDAPPADAALPDAALPDAGLDAASEAPIDAGAMMSWSPGASPAALR